MADELPRAKAPKTESTLTQAKLSFDAVVSIVRATEALTSGASSSAADNLRAASGNPTTAVDKQAPSMHNVLV